MKILFLSFFLFFGFLISAQARYKTAGADTTVDKTKIEQDGSSFDKAVVILEKLEGAGEKAEYSWIAKKYPGYKTKGQSLSYQTNKPFDIIHITTSDGVDKDIYFDISNFFGKF